MCLKIPGVVQEFALQGAMLTSQGGRGEQPNAPTQAKDVKCKFLVCFVWQRFFSFPWQNFENLRLFLKKIGKSLIIIKENLKILGVHLGKLENFGFFFLEESAFLRAKSSRSPGQRTVIRITCIKAPWQNCKIPSPPPPSGATC